MERERLHYYISNLKIRSDGRGRTYGSFEINGMSYLLFLDGWDLEEAKSEEIFQLFPDDDYFIDFYTNTFKELMRSCLIRYMHSRHKLNDKVFNSSMESIVGLNKKEHIVDFYKTLRIISKFK